MKKMLTFLFVALLAVGANAHTAVAQKAEPNQVWTAEAYCTDEAAVELLSQMMVKRGKAGYHEVMVADGVKCWDSRILNNLPTPQVTIIEKQWRVVTPRGQKFDFWTAVDKYGLLGWVWFLIEEPTYDGV